MPNFTDEEARGMGGVGGLILGEGIHVFKPDRSGKSFKAFVGIMSRG